MKLKKETSIKNTKIKKTEPLQGSVSKLLFIPNFFLKMP